MTSDIQLVDDLTIKLVTVLHEADPSLGTVLNSLTNLLAGIAVAYFPEDSKAVETVLDQVAEQAKLVASIKIEAIKNGALGL